MRLSMLYVLLFLLTAFPVMGETCGQSEEYARKQAILNERAARFKAETGFKGGITYNYRDMRFSRLTGTFDEIQISSPQDTIAAGYVLEQVFHKISPFISAREGQLFSSSTESNRFMVSQKWEQKVNGFSVYPNKFIVIAYNIPTKEFIINDSTVDIPSCPVQINIGMTEAKQLMLDAYKQSEYWDDQNAGFNRDPAIGYIKVLTSESFSQYRLCWSMMFDNTSVSVDAETQEIRYSEIVRIY